MSPSALPDGEDAPSDGSLPASALDGASDRVLAAYVHVPFCSSRCGYCDFNTYTAADLGGAPGTSRDAYLAALDAEMALASGFLGAHPLNSVFVGGGTPTQLDAAQLASILDGLRRRFGLVPDAEVTTEANPDSVTPDMLKSLVDAGFNRISFGMQSSVPHVLRVLDRTHTPGRALDAVGWARDAGFRHVSLDLIYGSPGESLDDWSRSLDAAMSTDIDHLSAYSLIVEEGTPLARRIRRGELPAPDEDAHADFYIAADDRLSAAGFANYEVSNWARPGGECRHNLSYWRGDDWWGFGPGAHSHVGGVRFWNVKHPRSYTERLAAGVSPAAGREVLSDDDRRIERVMLELRLAEGMDLGVLTDTECARIPALLDDDLAVITDGRLVLTRCGRLLADGIVRDLLD